MKIKWDCPSCKTKDAQIEEILVNTTVASIIQGIEIGELEYGEQTNSDGEVSRYQCVNCGCIISDSCGVWVTEQDELFKWLEKKSCLIDNS